jgi:hypothetical protein
MPVLTRKDIKTMYEKCKDGITYNEIPDKFKHLINEPLHNKHKNKLLQFHPTHRHFFYKGKVKYEGKMLTCMIRI